MFKVKPASYQEMVKTLQSENTYYIYRMLLESPYKKVIEDLYFACITGDSRIKEPDNIYLLFKDIAGSDMEKFSGKAEEFLKDKNQVVVSLYELDEYLEKLGSLSLAGNASSDSKAIKKLSEKISNYKKEAVDSLSRSVIMHLSDEDTKAFRRYVKLEAY